ncbi:BTB/POZ domain-containing protein FBL11 isoform X2 [Prunus yedoensis var. nudiflora]|uniref:BTB/POZ domain-containing protein FBL11 isoform X2 n=1 Tax=Prunus yedoensis var. nudiflora TaxID=2094558 RepID=A0A314UQ85_PRUYE|nr:BTB/POZ domain-containing protein FBL11 isoform X2 [Prunus yedoensis var. nudiflora]
MPPYISLRSDIPYNLLLSCVKHMNLTVDSEMHLSNALLVWIDANAECMEGLSRNEDVCTGILKQTTENSIHWLSRCLRS